MNVTDKIEPGMETVRLRHFLEYNDQSDEAKNRRCQFKKGSLSSRYIYILVYLNGNNAAEGENNIMNCEELICTRHI